MRLQLALIFLLVLLTLPITAVAEKGTPDEREACHRDTVRFCKGVPPQDDPMLHCLQANRKRISVACRTILEKYGQ
jgi:hypothetical protein